MGDPEVVEMSPEAAEGEEILVFEVGIEKSAQGELFDRALNDLQITEWSQAGHRVIKYPVDLGVLLQSTVMGTYHARSLAFKRLASIGNGYDTERRDAVRATLSDFDLSAFAADFFLFGNGYLERETNVPGRTVRLHHVRANSLWKKANGGWVQKVVPPEKDKIEFREIPQSKIAHLREYSPFSDHYGVPAWLAALLPVALAWASNDFKRKFYENGAHAGLAILLTGIQGLSSTQVKEIEEKIKGTKGPGNFKTLFLALKNPDAKLEVKGVAKESPVRDDYPEIQKSSREQVITAHGIPPRLMSIILDAKGGAQGGRELNDELRLFNLSFVEPTQLLLEEFLNPLLPAEIHFKSFLPDEQEEPAAPEEPDGPEDEADPAEGD
mgnify:CR=1 FL=1